MSVTFLPCIRARKAALSATPSSFKNFLVTCFSASGAASGVSFGPLPNFKVSSTNKSPTSCCRNPCVVSSTNAASCCSFAVRVSCASASLLNSSCLLASCVVAASLSISSWAIASCCLV